MDLTSLSPVYGPIGAAAVFVVGWIGKVIVEQILPQAREDRQRQIKAYERLADTIDGLRLDAARREERDNVRLLAVVDTLRELRDQMRLQGEDIARIFTRLDMPHDQETKS